MTYQPTYDSLWTDILGYTEEDSVEFTAAQATVIGNAELKVQRDLDLECFQCEIAAGALTIGTRSFVRPIGLVKATSLWLTIAGTKTPMDKKTYDYCNQFAPVIATQSPPVYYAEIDVNNYYFAPTPDQAYVVTAYGIERVASLSKANETNWLTGNVGDLLLKAALIESQEFLSNAGMVQQWQQEYQTRLTAAKLEYRGLSRAAYMMAIQNPPIFSQVKA